MTDRELLEMAAKAAGIRLEFFPAATRNKGSSLTEIEVTAWHGPYIVGTDGEDTWNPLTNDGDAFRLAVSLKLVIDAEWEACVTVERENVVFVGESTLIDPYAATRRAITRAAAEIGKSMDKGD